ncbi:hypothetical protein BU24DRAFT_169127 [Aaosphaeria arxii CBS 175.79]|uniref:Uncharacterized protein n=1 Tax=Aaosphaeria arxii CBS 175.79 TaxID=1450172 RepID=A0A6A5XZL8_9PLEO|nr:uncharacterized protein BU24DRAFT_169127 [Aaosphaeria arxii CBS 175.79]KAF2018353.1 hypothetical protein BU24DRAFT_169127 [Aaosphaeria arxii CBS 175.79]
MGPGAMVRRYSRRQTIPQRTIKSHTHNNTDTHTANTRTPRTFHFFSLFRVPQTSRLLGCRWGALCKYQYVPMYSVWTYKFRLEDVARVCPTTRCHLVMPMLVLPMLILMLLGGGGRSDKGVHEYSTKQ